MVSFGKRSRTNFEATLTTPPKTWVLLDDRPGHHTQVLGLADSLGWPYETRQLKFNGFSRIPNGLLGASLLSLDKAAAESLQPPFPDFVIAMGRRCIPVARWIRKSSNQSTQLVHLGRKGLVAPQEFGLMISCAHFNLPPHPQRLSVTLPPTQISRTRLNQARNKWPDLLDSTSGPHALFLMGGETAHHFFKASQAADLVQLAERAAEEIGASLTVVTSRRTSAAAIEAMQQRAKRAHFHLWQAGRSENPYVGYLASADILIVTGESESMLAEAAATGKPLFIAPLEGKPLSLKRRVVRWLTNRAGAGSAFCRQLFNSGWVTPFRDLSQMHQAMYAAGLAKPLNQELSFANPGNNDSMAKIVERLEGLQRTAEAVR